MSTKPTRRQVQAALAFYAGQEIVAKPERRRNDRPQRLVDLLIAGGDFAKDEEEQQRRAELEKQVELYKLAQPLLTNKRANLEQRTQEVHRRYSKACHDVDALLARLRLDHVAEMRR